MSNHPGDPRGYVCSECGEGPVVYTLTFASKTTLYYCEKHKPIIRRVHESEATRQVALR